MDIITIISLVTSVIGGASIILKAVAPLTKTNKDDKVLKILLKILEVTSLHQKDNSKLEIEIKDKQ